METAIKERNYRTVNVLRQKNRHEQKRLDEKINSKQGLRANHVTELRAVSKEQERIRQELVRIRQTITTTWGMLPPRGSPEGHIQEQRHMQLSNLMERGKKGRGQHKARANQSDKRQSKQKERTNQDVESAKDVVRPDRKAPVEDIWDAKETSRPNSGSSSNENAAEKGEMFESLNTDRSTNERSRSSLAATNIEEAKENVSKRLIGGSVPSKKRENYDEKSKSVLKSNNQDNQPRFLSPIKERSHEDVDRIEHIKTNSTGAKSKPIAPGNTKSGATEKRMSISDARIMEQLEHESNKNMYNPDGSLRTLHKLESFEKRYSHARKARYIRHKDPVESERELSANEVFAKRG